MLQALQRRDMALIAVCASFGNPRQLTAFASLSEERSNQLI